MSVAAGPGDMLVSFGTYTERLKRHKTEFQDGFSLAGLRLLILFSMKCYFAKSFHALNPLTSALGRVYSAMAVAFLGISICTYSLNVTSHYRYESGSITNPHQQIFSLLKTPLVQSCLWT